MSMSLNINVHRPVLREGDMGLHRSSVDNQLVLTLNDADTYDGSVNLFVSDAGWDAIVNQVNAFRAAESGHTVARVSQDTQALDAITAAMSGESWSADTLDRIADIVRASGRTVADCDERITEDDVVSNEPLRWYVCEECRHAYQAPEVDHDTTELCQQCWDDRAPIERNAR